MSEAAVPPAADAVVIGSGGLGAATAYYLAKRGLRVVLLDKAEMASQTSRRAAGLSGTLRDDDTMTSIAAEGVRRIERFTAETGEPMVFHQPGSLKVARRPEHADQLHEEAARGRRLGLDVVLLSPDEARELMPFLHTTGVTGVMHMRTDIYLEPRQVPEGYVRAAERLGAAVLPRTGVTALLIEGGAVTGVETSKGTVRAAAVVDAAGGWLRRVAALGGTRVGAVPTRHQLMVSVPLPGVVPTLPITRIIDANVYVRPENGGLMLGGYEARPMQVDVDALPDEWEIKDLELDESVLRDLAREVEAQFPIFRDVALQDHRGGLPTMTADGEHVVGPAPGLPGLWVIGGCCVGGLTTAPALGGLLAEWIVDGQPSVDLSAMSPTRRAAGLSGSELNEQCRLQYAHHYWSPASAAPHAVLP